MKKYITLFSLLAIFFMGMQQIQAQEKKTLDESKGKDKAAAVEKAQGEETTLGENQVNATAGDENVESSSPEQDAKHARLGKEMAQERANEQFMELKSATAGRGKELNGYQEKSAKIFFLDYQMNLVDLGVDVKNKKYKQAKLLLDNELDASLVEILNEEQLADYREFKAKTQNE